MLLKEQKSELDFWGANLYDTQVILQILISFLVTVVLMRLVETPVPIPNTEVKHMLVDGTGSIRAGRVG